jgi:hypothetical protein
MLILCSAMQDTVTVTVTVTVANQLLLQPATCNLQPATCNPQPATCNPQPATRNLNGNSAYNILSWANYHQRQISSRSQAQAQP